MGGCCPHAHRAGQAERGRGVVTGGGAAQDGLGAGGLAFTLTLCMSPSRGPGLGAGGGPGSGALGPPAVVLEPGFARLPPHGPAPGPWAAGPCPPFSRVLGVSGAPGCVARPPPSAGAGPLVQDGRGPPCSTGQERAVRLRALPPEPWPSEKGAPGLAPPRPSLSRSPKGGAGVCSAQRTPEHPAASDPAPPAAVSPARAATGICASQGASGPQVLGASPRLPPMACKVPPLSLPPCCTDWLSPGVRGDGLQGAWGQGSGRGMRWARCPVPGEASRWGGGGEGRGGRRASGSGRLV